MYFHPHSSHPYRIELFGDEIDSIRTFNIESQRSIEKVKFVEIFPAKEIILNEDSINGAVDKITNELNDFIKLRNKSENEAVTKITSTVKRNTESLKENWTFETIDSYLNYFFEEPADFFAYLSDYIIVVDDTQRCKGKIESVMYEFEENYSAFLQRGDILPSQGNLMLSKERVFAGFEGEQTITINSFAKTSDFLNPLNITAFSQITCQNYHGQLEILIDDIKDKKSKGFKTLILSGTRPRGERLVDTLRDRGIESNYRDNVANMEFGEVVITFGNQLKGFEYPELRVCVISDKEVFGEAKRKISKKQNKQKGV